MSDVECEYCQERFPKGAVHVCNGRSQCSWDVVDGGIYTVKCPHCGTQLTHVHCKLKCENCGYLEDCSDI